MSYYSGTVNPVPKGGSTSSDARTGLGIGSLHKGPASGLGSNWSMGDALSSPKGEYDCSDEEELSDVDVDKKFLDIDNKKYKKKKARIEKKAHVSFHVGAKDSLSQRGTHIGYMGGIGADMSAVIGMSASYQPQGDVLFEDYLKQYIKELLLSEDTNMSGRINVKRSPKAKNLGSKETYSVDTTTSHTNKMDNSSTQKGYINYGYGNSARTPDLDPYVVGGSKATNDGGRTVYNSDLEVNLEDYPGMSTFEILRQTSTDEYRSEQNVLKKRK